MPPGVNDFLDAFGYGYASKLYKVLIVFIVFHREKLYQCGQFDEYHKYQVTWNVIVQREEKNISDANKAGPVSDAFGSSQFVLVTSLHHNQFDKKNKNILL